MIQKEKELLLIDICARLPYGAMVHYHYKRGDKTIDEDRELDFSDVESLKYGNEYPQDNWCEISWKPYLRPMSSMTEEENTKYEYGFLYSNDLQIYAEEYIDWLNAHHFDYRGLIEKGLALEAPEGMY